jgi:hypothetical protein
LAEKWMNTTEHEGLYFEYWITFILYVLANTFFYFESDIIYGTPSVYKLFFVIVMPSEMAFYDLSPDKWRVITRPFFPSFCNSSLSLFMGLHLVVYFYC